MEEDEDLKEEELLQAFNDMYFTRGGVVNSIVQLNLEALNKGDKMGLLTYSYIFTLDPDYEYIELKIPFVVSELIGSKYSQEFEQCVKELTSQGWTCYESVDDGTLNTIRRFRRVRL